MTEPSAPLLQLRALSVDYARAGRELRAVNAVDLDLHAGECLGIVGESGSGKTQLLLALLGLNGAPARISGSIRYHGTELVDASAAQLGSIRGRRIALVSQDPMSALNPYLRIATQLTEGARRQLRLGRRAAWARAAELLALVQIDAPAERMRCYPHELSGGMRQRVTIAMALMSGPEVLLLDEPTTALDVTVQAQVLAVLRTVRERTGVATLMVTHDLGALAAMAGRVAVMYAGRLVELAGAQQLYGMPRHPYTAGLLRSLPRLDRPLPTRLPAIGGQPPDLADLPAGCAFSPRCPLAFGACAAPPALRPLSPGHLLACHYEGAPAAVAAAWR
ncbi:MAG: ABC transporter ATP-binding protein [Gammaproteobacteria bacterium]|nr:ABC transporter ATP-binding protein [Gammaproteobacteria bacterium]